jgi:DNA-binding response OmpR family regulator
MTATADEIDAHLHARRLRRLLESHGYEVASVTNERGRFVTVIAPPGSPRAALAGCGMELDVELHLLACGGTLVELTAIETTLLAVLLLRAESVVAQRELASAAWTGERPAACANRLYTHIFSLRRKLAAAGANASIQTYRRGYRLTARS